MPPLIDAFNSDSFTLRSLTAAIDKAPHAPSFVNSLGIFRRIPSASRYAMIEERRGVLALIPTTKRGTDGVPMRKGARVGTPVTIPHFEAYDEILADDVVGVRAFGTSEPATIDVVTAERVATMSRSLDATEEFCRIGALNGKVYYPTDGTLVSVDDALDLYTLFGMTNQATDRPAVDFVWGTDTTELAATVIPTIFDAMQTACGAEPITGAVALCGRTFFRKLIKQGTIIRTFDQQQALLTLNPVGAVMDGPQRRLSVTVGGITFVEYYGLIGTASGPGTDGMFQAAAEGIAFPLGPDIYHTYDAPADLIEAVGTLGRPRYAYAPREKQTEKSIGLAAQMNNLNIVTRPKAVVRLYSTT